MIMTDFYWCWQVIPSQPLKTVCISEAPILLGTEIASFAGQVNSESGDGYTGPETTTAALQIMSKVITSIWTSNVHYPFFLFFFFPKNPLSSSKQLIKSLGLSVCLSFCLSIFLCNCRGQYHVLKNVRECSVHSAANTAKQTQWMGLMIRALGFSLLFWLTVVSDFKVICVSMFMASAQIPAIKLQHAVLLVGYTVPGVSLR